MWLRSHPELKIIPVSKMVRELLIRFSFLRISSPALRVFIYDRGDWLKMRKNASGRLSLNTIDSYTTLDYLPLITDISDGTDNTYTAMLNNLTNDPAIFQYPDYVPQMDVTDCGDGPFAEEKAYHALMASFLLLGKWFEGLREQGVYDNTRIVIVSDHGKSVNVEYPDSILLPNNDRLSVYHALLMVKDFSAHGEFAADSTFMTNGDVPLIAMKDLIDNPKNPFSDLPIKTEKKDGVFIATSNGLQFAIKRNQWLYVHDNIFDPNNWEKAEK
jgi:hypothetical protein